MSGIPPEAIAAAEATLRGVLEPWLTTTVHGTTLDSQIHTAAACALRDAEKAWPHKPPQRDPASTTSGSYEHTWHHVQHEPAQAHARQPFGFGPPEVRA